MTDADITPPNTYLIEHLEAVHAVDHSTGLMTDRQILAWVTAGEITTDANVYPSAALEAWQDEQAVEPPVGCYRVLDIKSYGTNLHQFEIVETRERKIMRVELPEPNGELEQACEDIALVSRLARKPWPAVRREDRDTTTVEAAAAFERHHAVGHETHVAGARMDVDDVPGPEEI